MWGGGPDTTVVDIGRRVRDTSRQKPGTVMSHAELAKTIDDAFERRAPGYSNVQ